MDRYRRRNIVRASVREVEERNKEKREEKIIKEFRQIRIAILKVILFL